MTADDPARFPPTLGEMDLHLLAEATHRQPWSVMGSHLRQLDGVDGASFATWAPTWSGRRLWTG